MDTTLKVEFPWDETPLSQIEPTMIPAQLITDDMELSLAEKN